jgi:hypothetical protein
MSSIYAQLLAALDQQFIFKDSVSSSVKRLDVYHDYKTRENVVLLEYRVQVDGDPSEEDDQNDDDGSGPRIDGARKVRMDRARRQIMDSWNKELESLREKYPSIDDYYL